VRSCESKLFVVVRSSMSSSSVSVAEEVTAEEGRRAMEARLLPARAAAVEVVVMEEEVAFSTG
jgi:hypothetical protein